MFPGQRLIPVANHSSLQSDIETRCYYIISLISSILSTTLPTHHSPEPETLPTERRDLVFPLLLAGIVSTNPDTKIQAADLTRSLENPNFSGSASSVQRTPGGAVVPPPPSPLTPVGSNMTPVGSSTRHGSGSSASGSVAGFGGGAGGGIGQNTYRMRQLLAAVCEEQRRVLGQGGRMEAVDWLVLAKERGLMVVHCGL